MIPRPLKPTAILVLSGGESQINNNAEPIPGAIQNRLKSADFMFQANSFLQKRDPVSRAWASFITQCRISEPSLDCRSEYQNPFIFDASGRLLDAYTAGGAIINSKGYRLRLYTSHGYYVNWAIFFESPDCSGQGYGIPAEANGDVFLSYDQTGDYMIAYTEIGATPVNITYRSLRRSTGGCETSTYAASYVPVFPNDPEITGVPNNIGARDNPYPGPFYFERY